MLALLQIPVYLGSIMLILVPVSLPVCAVQLALVRLCRNRFLQWAPAILGGALLAAGCIFFSGYGYDALLGIFLMVPALMLLTGSGLGWLVWYLSRKYLH